MMLSLSTSCTFPLFKITECMCSVVICIQHLLATKILPRISRYGWRIGDCSLRRSGLPQFKNAKNYILFIVEMVRVNTNDNCPRFQVRLAYTSSIMMSLKYQRRRERLALYSNREHHNTRSDRCRTFHPSRPGKVLYHERPGCQ
jgi:hypothetical protein